MPLMCVETCNPVCCAICVTPGRATGSDDVGTASKSVFANAASVLSNAAEEIQLSNHLENELANEVELWRMETSGVDTITGLAVLHRGEPYEGRVTVPFARERSLSPPPRTQVSLHDRVGLAGGAGGDICMGRRLGSAEEAHFHPRGRANGDDADAAAGAAGTGSSAAGSLPLLDGAADAAAGSPKPEASGEQLPTVTQRGRDTAPRSISVSFKQDCEERAGPPQAEGPRSTAAAAAALGAAVAAERAAAAAIVPQPRVGPTPGVSSAQLAQMARARLSKTGQVPAPAFSSAIVGSATRTASGGTRRLPHEWGASESFSSSEGSTFVGFIEDPLEKERASEPPMWFSGSVEGQRM